MANGDDEGLMGRIKKGLRERAAKHGKEVSEKAEAEKVAKAAKKAEADKAKPSGGQPMGPGGYGGRAGAEAQKRQIEQEERGEEPTTTGVSFRSSNGGQTGRMSATARRARDKRLNGIKI